jgi:cytochrome oxidase assembly protein ShyY1
LLTPLVTADGSAVIVDRGWVPIMFSNTPVEQAPPPKGRVTVEGFLLPNEGGLAAGTPGPNGDRVVSRLDIPLLRRAFAYPLYPLAVRLSTQAPPQPGDLPTVVPLEKLDEGPHLSYAVQWFMFAAFALIAYALLLRNAAREKARMLSTEGSSS